MDNLKRTARMGLALAVLSLFSLGASVFALDDIAHAGGNPILAWGILRVTALILLMFIALAGVVLLRVLRSPAAAS